MDDLEIINDIGLQDRSEEIWNNLINNEILEIQNNHIKYINIKNILCSNKDIISSDITSIIGLINKYKINLGQSRTDNVTYQRAINETVIKLENARYFLTLFDTIFLGKEFEFGNTAFLGAYNGAGIVTTFVNSFNANDWMTIGYLILVFINFALGFFLYYILISCTGNSRDVAKYNLSFLCKSIRLLCIIGASIGIASSMIQVPRDRIGLLSQILPTAATGTYISKALSANSVLMMSRKDLAKLK